MAASLVSKLRQFVFGVLPLYGPLLLMALLALGTWWLVQHSPLPQEPEAARQVTHTPDYDMQGFSVRRFDDAGELISVVSGDAMHHYPDTDTLEVEQIRLHASDDKGQRIQAKAHKGMVDSKNNLWSLLGGAEVVRLGPDEALDDAPQSVPKRPADGQDLVIRGESLQMNSKTHDVRSDQTVTMIDAHGWVRAGSLSYSDSGKTATLKGGVAGQLMPRH